MEKNTGWKRIVYLMCAIQVGAGIAMIGVMAFLPLFLGEIGVTDAGEAAFWAGLISGVTPFMIALSAPFWSIQADRRGPKLVMSIVLAAVTLTAFLCAVSTSPWQVFIFRLLQGLVGGFVPIGLSVNRWLETPYDRPLLPAVNDYYQRLGERPGFRRYGCNGTP